MRRAIPLILAVFVLASCSLNGGDGQDLPTYSGSEKLESQTMSFSDVQFDYSDGNVAVYQATDPFDQVAVFYRDGVTSAGWTVDRTVPLREGQSISYLSKDDTVVIAQVLNGVAARDQSEILRDALETDFSTFQDADTVIILTHLSCDEDGGAPACIESLTGQ